MSAITHSFPAPTVTTKSIGNGSVQVSIGTVPGVSTYRVVMTYFNGSMVASNETGTALNITDCMVANVSVSYTLDGVMSLPAVTHPAVQCPGELLFMTLSAQLPFFSRADWDSHVQSRTPFFTAIICAAMHSNRLNRKTQQRWHLKLCLLQSTLTKQFVRQCTYASKHERESGCVGSI